MRFGPTKFTPPVVVDVDTSGLTAAGKYHRMLELRAAKRARRRAKRQLKATAKYYISPEYLNHPQPVAIDSLTEVVKTLVEVPRKSFLSTLKRFFGREG